MFNQAKLKLLMEANRLQVREQIAKMNSEELAEIMGEDWWFQKLPPELMLPRIKPERVLQELKPEDVIQLLDPEERLRDAAGGGNTSVAVT